MKLHEIVLLENTHGIDIVEFCTNITRPNKGNGQPTTFTISSNNVIDVDGNVFLSDRDGTLDEIPFKFGKVTEIFDCGDTDITSLKNSPDSVLGNFLCNDTKITSLEHAPQEIGGFLIATNCPITSLVGIEHQLGHVRELRLSFDKIKEGGLGLLNIESLVSIATENFKAMPLQFFIIDSHLKNKDIFACQAELIEAGFEEYTKL